MLRITGQSAVGCLAMLCCSVAQARAQIQQRSDGHLNDVNPMVGSGGLNQPVTRQAINATNLIVTGNVTGGRAFRGFSPVRDSSQFFTTLSPPGGRLFSTQSTGDPRSFVGLPSAGLDNFYRDSVSVGDTPGRLDGFYRPRPFFSSSQTIINAGAIAAGRNMPGTSMPQNIYQVPNLNFQLPEAQLVVPGTPEPGDTRLESGAFPEPGRSDTDRPNLVNPWIVQSELFASNLYIRRQQQASLLSLLQARRARLSVDRALQEEAAEESAADATLDMRIDRRVDTRISPGPIEYEDSEQAALRPDQNIYADYNLPGTAALLFAGASRTTSPESSEMVSTPEDRRNDTGRAPTGEVDSTGSGLETPPTEHDALEDAARWAEAYRDEYVQQRRAELLEGALPGLPGGPALRPEGSSAAPGEEQTTPETEAGDLPGEYALPVSGKTTRRPSTIDQLAELHADRVITLVGKSDTLLNRQLAAAEELLRNGQYFRAAGQYQIAGVMAPSSPLPDIGRAHALIAAGDYYTAVRHLIRGLRAWPGFANFRLDLNGFIPDQDLLDRRRADLEQRLSEIENHEFRFLLGYIEYSMGLEDFGLENINRAAAGAPRDSVLATMPKLFPRRAEAESTEPDAQRQPTGP